MTLTPGRYWEEKEREQKAEEKAAKAKKEAAKKEAAEYLALPYAERKAQALARQKARLEKPSGINIRESSRRIHEVVEAFFRMEGVT